MKQRAQQDCFNIFSLDLSWIQRDGAETIPGSVKSRKARKLTPPRNQGLPKMRRKRWRRDDALAPRRATINMLLM